MKAKPKFNITHPTLPVDQLCDIQGTAHLTSFLVESADRTGRADRPAKTGPWRYQSTYELVLKEGLSFKTLRPLPRSFAGEPKECFNNAFVMTMWLRSVGISAAYCEGWALAPEMNEAFPIHHAWVALPGGMVADPTWYAGQFKLDRAAYYGAILDFDYVEQHRVKYNTATVLDAWVAKWPILKMAAVGYLSSLPDVPSKVIP